jgi:hypothetical protein
MNKIRAILLVGFAYIGFVATCFVCMYAVSRILEKMGVIIG